MAQKCLQYLYGAKNMNMISTGAFQTEMDASNKQPTLAEKFAAVWEKKNAKAARAGGVSLMALSLAACGSDDATTTTATTTDTTATTTTTTTTVDAAQTLTLTTAINSGSAFTGGSGDDTFQATHATLSAGDILVGGDGTDTLNIQNTGTGAYTAPAANVSGIENITVINQSGSTAVTGVSAVTAVKQVVTITSPAPSATGNDVTVTYGTATQVVATSGANNNAHADILVAAINALAGATVAVARTGGASDHIIDVTAPVAGTALPFIGFSAFTVVADAPTVAYTTANVEAVTAVTAVLATTASTMTVNASNYTGATDFTSNGSTGLTNFTNMTAGQAATMDAGSGGMGIGYGATVTSSAINVSGGTTAGDLTLTGAAVTSTDITASGKTNTVGTIDLAGSSTVTLAADTKFTATQIDTTATAGSLTISGAGAVNIGTLDDGFVTVNASGNSGGLTMTGPANSPNASITLSSGADVFTTDDDGFTAAQTFAVNAGDGTDILVVAAAADINAATESARYTNFETVRIGDTYDADQIAGITAIQLTGATSKSYTDLTATQAASVQVRGDETSATFALKSATGTADALNLTMGTGLTTAAATDIVTGMTVTGFETISITENGGPSATAGANQTAIIAAFTTPTTLNNIDLAGRAVTLSDIATTVAVDIDGTALTGNGNASGVQGLNVGGSAVAGSVINGSAVNDSLTIGAEGSTYNGNAGTDAFSTTPAIMLADGATDLVVNGGAGTDTITFTGATGHTYTDAHFTNISNMEGMTMTNTGAAATSITTGAAFNAAFADGVTITSGVIAAAQDIAIVGGLSTVDMTVSIAATSQTGASTETNSIVTGSGADTVTYTDTGYVGVSGAAGGTFAIDTNAGNDTISVTTGTFVQDSTAGILDITGGSGQDSITVNAAKVNDGTSDIGCVRFLFAAGDSNTVTYDTITGFDTGTAGAISDELDFEGTAAVASFTANNDFGTIKSHSVTTGVITFDDAASFVAAVTVNAANLADVVGYLQANMTANHTGAFLFDSTGNGAGDGTMIFHQGSAAGVADDLVFLAGVTGVADVSITTNNTGANDLFVA
jgi:hypothetical protein